MHQNTEVLSEILDHSPNHFLIKNHIKYLSFLKQSVTYHAFTSTSSSYLQNKALTTHDYHEFNYISTLLNGCRDGVLERIEKNKVKLKDLIEEERELEKNKQKVEKQVPKEIKQQVEQLMADIDLPISLYNKNDRYWDANNPKTIRAKNYVNKIQKSERRRRQMLSLEVKRQEREVQSKEKQEMKQERRRSEEKVMQFKKNVKRKLQNIKKGKKQREQQQKQTDKIIKNLNPLYKKIQQQEKIKKQLLEEEEKQIIKNIKKNRKSIDLVQIERHKQKIQTFKQNFQHHHHNVDKPVSVSFKSKYHTSMSYEPDLSEEKSIQSLYEKKMLYGKTIMKEHKPKISRKLIEQREQRKTLTKGKRKKYNILDEESQKSEDQMQNERKSIQELISEPDRKERYSMGLEFLEYMRNLKKYSKEEVEKQKIRIKSIIDEERMKEKQKSARPKYKDYLKDRSKRIDLMNPDQIGIKCNKVIMQKSIERKVDLDSEVKKIEKRTKRQEKMLRNTKLDQQETLNRKMGVDEAMISGIRARLILMN